MNKIKDIYYGVRNYVNFVRHYSDVMANDVDWDWASLVKLIERKLYYMEQCIRHGHHVSAERDARQIHIAYLLCRRLIEDNYYNQPYRKIGLGKDKHNQASRDAKYLGRYLGKHLLSWWD